jgi:hypothetical protein
MNITCLALVVITSLNPNQHSIFYQLVIILINNHNFENRTIFFLHGRAFNGPYCLKNFGIMVKSAVQHLTFTLI